MWSLETIHQINRKIAELTRNGELEKKDALRECGISMPHHCINRNKKKTEEKKEEQQNAPMM